jgi:hypothetical protein
MLYITAIQFGEVIYGVTSSGAAKGQNEVNGRTPASKATHEEPPTKAKPTYDPNDVVAQVLNFSTFGKDDGLTDSFWYRVGPEGCKYKRYTDIQGGMPNADRRLVAMLATINAFDPSEIDLNQLDPQSLQVGYDDQLHQDFGYLVVVKDAGKLVTASRISLDVDRLKRGWGLIYEKYCSGKHRPF